MITWVLDDKNRIDHYFLEFGYQSRSSFKEAFEQGEITVNDKVPKRNYRLRENDVLMFKKKVETKNIQPSIEIQVLYEDEYLLIINKPPFIAVHPAKSYNGETVVDWLLYHNYPLSNLGGTERPGIVHRLDKDTSGILVIAKDNRTHEILSGYFKDRKVVKRYLALVHHVPKENHFIVDEPIARSPNPTKMAVVKGGRQAMSIVDVRESNDKFALLDVEIKTGRTHQIRVHLSYKGFPIVGDRVYGLKKEKIKVDRQMLHAYYTSFLHPYTKKELFIKAPLPEDFKATLLKAHFQDLHLSF